MFLKNVSYVNQSCIYLIKNGVKTDSNIVKYNYNWKYLFSTYTSHDPLEVVLL